MTSLLNMTRLLFLLLAVLLSAVPSHAADTVTYLHPDTHGSPAMATDAAGNVVWRESYLPYGERRLKQSTANGLWYTGKIADDETGLVYLGARWYDPSIGRFLAVDPEPFSEANLASFNRYAYGNNNPLSWIDPTGLFSFTVEYYEVWGGTFTIGRDNSTGQWFYGGGLGFGLGGGFTIDPSGSRPGAAAAAAAGKSFNSGTSVGTYAHLGISIPGFFSWDPFQAAGGYDFSTGNGYSEGPAPAENASLTRELHFAIGGGYGFNVFGH